MKKLLAMATLALCTLSGFAQTEKTMCVQKTDGTYALTRVAELSKISFLSIDDPGKGLIVSTSVAEPVGVFFEDSPEVTVSAGKLIVASKSAASPVEIEIDNITEITFGTPASVSVPGQDAGVECVLQPGAALFRGISEGTAAEIYTVDGRAVTAPAVVGGELRLDRDSLGSGIFIVCIGTFTTKVTL